MVEERDDAAKSLIKKRSESPVGNEARNVVDIAIL